MKKFKMISVLTALCLISAAVVTASGCSAKIDDLSAGVNGAVPVTETPVILEEQNVTFSVYDFPGRYGSGLDYSSLVTTEYKMYNPDNRAQTVSFALPLGFMPDYLKGDTADLENRYSVTVDGAHADIAVRHTYISGNKDFNAAEEAAKIRDGFAESGVYSYDATVTEYVYAVGGNSRTNYRVRAKDLTVGKDSRVFLPLRCKIPAWGAPYFQTFGESEFAVYVVGQPIDGASWVYEEDGAASAECRLLRRRTLTFGQFALRAYDETSGVLKRDWFNAVVDKLSASDDKLTGVSALNIGDFIKWYRYSVTVPAEGRAVAAVTAPTFPSILTHSDNPDRYEYRYDLDPSSQWAEVRGLNVTIDTCYQLVENKGWNFAVKDGGYTAAEQFGGKNRPKGNLTFSLSTFDYEKGRIDTTFLSGLIIILIFLSPVLFSITIAVVLTVVNRKNKKKAEEKMKRLY